MVSALAAVALGVLMLLPFFNIAVGIIAGFMLGGLAGAAVGALIGAGITALFCAPSNQRRPDIAEQAAAYVPLYERRRLADKKQFERDEQRYLASKKQFEDETAARDEQFDAETAARRGITMAAARDLRLSIARQREKDKDCIRNERLRRQRDEL